MMWFWVLTPVKEGGQPRVFPFYRHYRRSCRSQPHHVGNIARRLVEKGLRVGFLKPFGTHPVKLDRFWTRNRLKYAVMIPNV